jgi:hypothetical protein
MRTLHLGSFGVAMLLAACATPAEDQITVPGDMGFSCEQLVSALGEAQRLRDEAQSANVDRIRFFWPLILGSSVDYSAAIALADAKKARLAKLLSQKRCPVPSGIIAANI